MTQRQENKGRWKQRAEEKKKLKVEGLKRARRAESSRGRVAWVESTDRVGVVGPPLLWEQRRHCRYHGRNNRKGGNKKSGSKEEKMGCANNRKGAESYQLTWHSEVMLTLIMFVMNWKHTDHKAHKTENNCTYGLNAKRQGFPLRVIWNYTPSLRSWGNKNTHIVQIRNLKVVLRVGIRHTNIVNCGRHFLKKGRKMEDYSCVFL